MFKHTVYKGRLVPELIQKNKPRTCANSYCQGEYWIACDGCIKYPTGEVKEILEQYEKETCRDEQIQEGVERVLDGQRYEGS